MKRIVLTVLCLCLLCGCKSSRSVISENGRFLVSAIGIDTENKDMKVTVEAIVVNSQDTEQSPKACVFEGSDTAFSKALENAVSKSAKPLDFSHCAVVVFGEKTEETAKNDVYKFCLENKQITVSVGFAKTENANKILKLKPISEIAVGYEMAVMLETAFTENKTAFNNRFFEIENARLKGEKAKTLPFFKIKDDMFYLKGDKN